MKKTIIHGSQQPTNARGCSYDEFFRIGEKNKVFAFHNDEEHLFEKARVADAFSLLQKCEDMTDKEKNEIRIVLSQYNTLLWRHFDVLHKSDKYEKEQEC